MCLLGRGKLVLLMECVRLLGGVVVLVYGSAVGGWIKQMCVYWEGW